MPEEVWQLTIGVVLHGVGLLLQVLLHLLAQPLEEAALLCCLGQIQRRGIVFSIEPAVMYGRPLIRVCDSV